MSLWTASVAVLAIVGQAADRTGIKPDAGAPVVKSLIQISSGLDQSGYGVLIDSRGLFLAHRSAISSDQVVGRLSTGTPIILNVIFQDAPSELVLLKPRLDGELPKDMPAVRVAKSEAMLSGDLTAYTVGGPLRGDWVKGARAGILQSSNRFVPLNEMRFETPRSKIGGALVFNQNGELAGVLCATLEVESVDDEGQPKSGNFGPQGLTVGYTLGLDVLDRVVEGFRTERHAPAHPSIGVQFANGSDGTVVVRTVVADSPAAKAGITSGDVIVTVAGQKVRTAIECGSVLFRQKVGAKLDLGIRSPGQKEARKVVVDVANYYDLAAAQRKTLETPFERRIASELVDLQTIRHIHTGP